MAVQYDDNNKFKALTSILEDYTEWFSQLSLHVAYLGEYPVAEGLSMPRSFADWLESSEIHTEVSATVLQPIIDMHSVAKDVSTDLIEDLKLGKKPNHIGFVEFKNLYSAFLSSIRRLERDSAMKGDGTDDLTGLRPSSAVKHDLDREMERLSRSGNPFALVILRIDQFEIYEYPQEVVVFAAEIIKKSMRPFDDAYYLEDGQFLLSLKHTDMVGAEVAIVRIQHSLSLDEANEFKITTSGCMSEPVRGDEISDLLENMQNDLLAHDKDHGSVLKLLDISPLERFVGAQDSVEN